MTQENNTPETVTPEPKSIVSVNSRGGSSNNAAGKLFFVFMIIAIVLVGGLLTFNHWRAGNKVKQAAEEKVNKDENKPATVGQHRQFDTDPPPLPEGASGTHGNQSASSASAGVVPNPCSDGSPGTVMLGSDGKPMIGPNGSPMRVCKDGRVVVPAVEGSGGQFNAATGGRNTNQQGTGTPPPSRYAGDVVMTSSSSSSSGGASYQPAPSGGNSSSMATLAILQNMLAQSQKAQAGSGSSFTSTSQTQNGSNGSGTQASQGASPAGSIGSLLTPSQTPMVTASMIGDQNMILPKGRSIDCGLSMRLVNEVAGMASCVVSRDVYSDNGRVVLLEHGSEATGEYTAAMAQGQRRLFVLWTRIKTPSGVVINLNSPGADGLGTSGLEGYVDNHWWDRLGAAFMLSIVQDAIAYETAKSTPPGGNNVYQNTAATGNRMAEKVLDNTINIKPTLYKNQGDRGTIYVSRDLDFGSVYALRAR